MKKKRPTLDPDLRLESTTIIRSFLISFFCICLGFFATGQTGPGGIGNSASNPLWLDAHTMGGLNGGAISSWTDYSGNGINAAQPLTTKQPTFVTGAVNGRDAIDFNGTQNINCPATSSMDNVMFFDWYVVSQIDNFNILSIPFVVDYGSTGALDVFAGLLTQNGLPQSSFGHNSSAALIKANFPVTSGYNLYQGVYNSTANTVSSNTNFTQNAVNTNNSFNTATHQGFNIGGKNTAYRMNGQISEVFVFNFVLNTAQKKILQNYISSKFGTVITTDLYGFDGTHGLGVIGIGQDDVANSHTDSQGNTVVRLNTPSALSDGEYLFVGHDDKDLSTFSINVPAPLETRFKRTWQVQKTGDLGSVTLIFDLDASTDFSANSSNYRLLVDADGDFSTVNQSISGTYNAGANSITFTNVNLATGDFFTLAGDMPGDIYSIASGNWSNPSTWDCGCVPSQLNKVFINPGHIVEVDVDGECLDLFVDATGGGLTMNSGSNLDIYGSFDLLGTLTASTGQISFVGTSGQYFDANGATVDLNNILISNTDPAGVTFMTSQYILNGTLSVNVGTLIIPSGTGLIINSTTANTEGRIGTLPVGAAITGNVSVRRFIPAGLADWRDICSPVIGATFTNWDPDLAMSGTGFPDGCAYGLGGCFASVRYTVNGTSVNVYNVTDPITNGRGYNVFMGDDLVNFSGTTLTSTGTVNGSSDIPKSLNTGWHTIGNPYVSPMLYSLTTRTSQISNYFYVYDASIGDYQWYDGATSSSSIPELAGGLMNTYQGIWVYASSLGTITFHQTDKTTSATFLRSEEAGQDVSLKLILKENSTTYQSSILIEESLFATDNMDSLMDMRQLNNGFEAAPRISISTNGDLVRKNYIQDDKRNKSFNLETKFNNAGYYTIEASNFENFTNYRKIVLFDNQTGDFIDLKTEQSYTFYSEITEGHRFTLILTNAEISTEATVQSLTINESEIIDNGLAITQMGNTFNIVSTIEYGEDSQIKLVNVLGQQEVFMQSIKLIEGGNLISIPEEFSGVHILVVTTGDRIVTKKVVL